MDKELARWLHSKKCGQCKVEMSGVYSSVSGPVLFNIFVSNMDSGNKRTLSKCADNNKLCDAVNMLEGKGCHPKKP